MQEEISTKKSRRRARVADANERIRTNAALRPAMKLFTDCITYGSIKRKVSKMAQSNRVIITAIETNKKRH